MTSFSRGFALLAAACLIAATACDGDSGGGSMTLEEYFTQLERIGNDAEARVGAIEVPAASEDFAASRDAFVVYFDELVGASDDAIAEVRDLDPPDEAADQHDTYVSALEELPGLVDDYRNRIAGAASRDELTAIVNDSPDIIDATSRIGDACKALQDVADDNSIDVDLECS